MRLSGDICSSPESCWTHQLTTPMNSTLCDYCNSDNCSARFSDDWKLDANASVSKTLWRNRCASHCAMVAPNPYQLAYVQVELEGGGTCSCYETETPQTPADTDTTQWLGRHALRHNQDTDIYVVRVMHPQQTFVIGVGWSDIHHNLCRGLRVPCRGIS